MREKSKKLKNKVKTLIKNFEDRLNQFESNATAGISEIKRKQEEVEQKTYWKIKDYEELLRTRVSETLLKDMLTEERNKMHRQVKEMLEYRAEESNRRYDVLTEDTRSLRETLDDKLSQLSRFNEEAKAKYEEKGEALSQQVKALGNQVTKPQADPLLSHRIRELEDKLVSHFAMVNVVVELRNVCGGERKCEAGG